MDGQLPPRYILCKLDDDTLAGAEREVREAVLPYIPDFKDFRLYPVRNFRKHLGKYILNSHKLPVVVIDPRACKKAAEEYECELHTVYLTTILHELGHAVQEARGLKFDEEQAESLALVYWRTGDIAQWVKDIKL